MFRLHLPIGASTMEAEAGKKLRRQRVLFETDRHLVVGDVTLPAEGYKSRFSDVVNREEVAFIPLLDVEVTPLGGTEAERHEFMVLAKGHVRLAYPLDEPADQ
jgi:hypothetical protein